MQNLEFHLERESIEAKTHKLDAVWTCESAQKVICYYGSKDIYWYVRCLDNACKVKKIRRKKYWMNQYAKYDKRILRGNK